MTFQEEYEVTHFVGYLRTDLSSNLKLTQNNIKKETNEEAKRTESSMHWQQVNSISTGKIEPSSACSSLTTNSNTPTLQNYLIACGKIKHTSDEIVQRKYFSRHDADGKFIYLDTK